MNTRRKIPRIIWLIAVACVVLPAAYLAWTRPEPPQEFHFPNTALRDVDKVVQARFAEVPTNDFGMGRMGPRHELFHPTNQTERLAIEALRASGQEVVFYMASRNYILRTLPNNQKKTKLQGPIYMTQKPPLKVTAVLDKIDSYYTPPVFQTSQKPRNLPDARLLWQHLHPMLEKSVGGQHKTTPAGTSFEWGEWKVLAVPVRASAPACLSCHKYFDLGRQVKPELGDPLGVAMYAYRPTAARRP